MFCTLYAGVAYGQRRGKQRMRFASVTTWLMLAALTGCQGARVAPGSPPGVTEEPGAAALAGAQAAATLEQSYGGVVRELEIEGRLGRCGARLLRGTPQLAGSYQYRLLASKRRNAFSLPGGRIYLTCGLYEILTSDDQLAAVVAHEMAHLEFGDCLRRCVAAEEMLQRELDADQAAIEYLRAADVPASALAELLGLISEDQPPAWSERRLAALGSERTSCP